MLRSTGVKVVLSIFGYSFSQFFPDFEKKNYCVIKTLDSEVGKTVAVFRQNLLSPFSGYKKTLMISAKLHGVTSRTPNLKFLSRESVCFFFVQ